MARYAIDIRRWIENSGLDEADLMASPELARMIDPHRLTNPLPLRCPKNRCNDVIVYLALSGQQARVEFGPKVRTTRIKGIYPNEVPEEGPPIWFEPETITSSAADIEHPGLPAHLRFDPYLEWALLPDSNVELSTDPTVKAPYPLRFRFTCRKCGAAYRHTNKRLLIEFFRALSLKKRDVRPGRI